MGESNKFVYDTSEETGKPLTTHQFYDGTPHPWEFKRVWHLEPSLDDPDTVFAGIEDAASRQSVVVADVHIVQGQVAVVQDAAPDLLAAVLEGGLGIMVADALFGFITHPPAKRANVGG